MWELKCRRKFHRCRYNQDPISLQKWTGVTRGDNMQHASSSLIVVYAGFNETFLNNYFINSSKYFMILVGYFISGISIFLASPLTSHYMASPSSSCLWVAWKSKPLRARSILRSLETRPLGRDFVQSSKGCSRGRMGSSMETPQTPGPPATSCAAVRAAPDVGPASQPSPG